MVDLRRPDLFLAGRERKRFLLPLPVPVGGVQLLPQLGQTERPDKFAGELLDGCVGLLVDGLPMGYLLPTTFRLLMHTPEDEAHNYLLASALIVLRYFALAISLTFPALYVAVAMYHQEMIPTQLLLSIIEAKQNVPFSTALEIMGMLISFELLQEAGLRLPNPIGDTVSIIGALIVGQSAVEAQVVSPIAIIVVAVSGIAGYTLPSQDFGSAIRLLRFVLVIASILAGFFGVGAALCLLTLHLADIDSFGVDYTAPLSDGEPSPLRRLLLQKPKPLNKFATRISKLRIKGGRNEKSDLCYPCARVRVHAYGLHKRVFKLQRDRAASRHSGHGAR